VAGSQYGVAENVAEIFIKSATTVQNVGKISKILETQKGEKALIYKGFW
jgi:hypothetical protein